MIQPARSKIFHTHHIAYSTCIIMKEDHLLSIYWSHHARTRLPGQAHQGDQEPASG
nr:MAG TPA: hypothetical protein [Caudoviricetes sp.]